MNIQKTIHYCWFGRAPLPATVLSCIESWKKYCPDYEIIQWNEDNFDVNAIRYTREAYERKYWAFVSDYVRLRIVYDYGGIYLDTDVELLKPLDSLLGYEGFMGFEDDRKVASGLGFGAVPHHPVIGRLLEDYREPPFVKADNTLDLTPCPDRNTQTLLQLGLVPDNRRQTIGGLQILPSEYLCPLDFNTGKMKKTENTLSIHHFHGTWLDEAEHKWLRLQRLIGPWLYKKIRYQWKLTWLIRR